LHGTQHCFFLLIPHSSNLLQPLDVGVFGPLKKVVSSRLSWLLHCGVTRLEKIEWVENYIEAREVALTAENIRGGLRGAGLVPLNRARVTRSLPEVLLQPSTSPEPGSTIPEHQIHFNTAFRTDRTPDSKTLRSLSRLVSKNELHTPERNSIPRLTNNTEQLIARIDILEYRLEHVEKRLGVRQERKKGKRATLKGVNFINDEEDTHPEVLDFIVVAQC
jgi:hypothetical protein